MPNAHTKGADIKRATVDAAGVAKLNAQTKGGYVKRATVDAPGVANRNAQTKGADVKGATFDAAGFAKRNAQLKGADVKRETVGDHDVKQWTPYEDFEDYRDVRRYVNGKEGVSRTRSFGLEMKIITFVDGLLHL